MEQQRARHYSVSSRASTEISVPEDEEYIQEYLNKLKKSVREFEKNQEKNIGSKVKTVKNYEIPMNERLWTMKNNSEFIDAKICSNDGYFEFLHFDMLITPENNLKEALIEIGNINPFIKEYKIETSGDVLKHIIYFSYHKKTELTEKNSLAIADFGAKYRFFSLVNFCIDYFQYDCNIEKSIKGMMLTSKLMENENFRSAYEFFKTHIENDFELVLEENKKELMEFEPKMMLDLLSSQKLNIIDERIVWNVFEQWIEKDCSNRLKYLQEFFLNALRFGRLPDDFLENQVLKGKLFERLPTKVQSDIKNWMMEQKSQRLIIQDGYKLWYSLESVYFQPRETKELLLVAGGWVEGQTTNSWEAYDYQTNTWASSPLKLERKISYFGLELVNEHIYVFGGSNGREIFRTVEAYNLNGDQRSWITKCSMIEPRCYVSSAVLDGLIYAIGGFNQRTRIRRCECYQPETNSWREIAELNYARSDASAVAHQGKIYIAGGINDACIERSVEVYYPEENVWRLVRSMNTPRTSFSIASFGGKIWALGGNDGVIRSNTVECYDVESDSWTIVDSMLTKRSTFRSVVLRKELFVAGGYNGQSPISSVEKFVGGNENKWVRVRELRHDRSGLSLLCVPNKFPQIKF